MVLEEQPTDVYTDVSHLGSLDTVEEQPTAQHVPR
jgi:hypothetical protein